MVQILSYKLAPKMKIKAIHQYRRINADAFLKLQAWNAFKTPRFDIALEFKDAGREYIITIPKIILKAYLRIEEERLKANGKPPLTTEFPGTQVNRIFYWPDAIKEYLPFEKMPKFCRWLNWVIRRQKAINMPFVKKIFGEEQHEHPIQ